MENVERRAEKVKGQAYESVPHLSLPIPTFIRIAMMNPSDWGLVDACELERGEVCFQGKKQVWVELVLDGRTSGCCADQRTLRR